MILPLSILIICISLGLLFILAVIDLRTRLLPDIYVLPFAILAITFHTMTQFQILSPQSIMLGALYGGGSLYLIRLIANSYYKIDTLGLGDVKLMGAAGLWLGEEYIFLALCLGAFAGVLHGILYVAFHKLKTGQTIALSTLAIPAGPGFIVGIIVGALFKFQSMLHMIPILP